MYGWRVAMEWIKIPVVRGRGGVMVTVPQEVERNTIGDPLFQRGKNYYYNRALTNPVKGIIEPNCNIK